IMLMNTEGRFIDSFILPGNVHMKASQQGPRQNGVFEGSTFVKNKSRLLVSIEEPLYEDGPRAGLNDSAALLRILEFDVKDRKPLAQYAYRADPVAHPPDPPGSFRINGISEILARNDHQLFVVERSYSTARRSSTIKIYMAELNGATDVSNYSSLSGVALHFIEKQLVLNMDTLGIYVDNVEGICFGPILPNGHKTIILVSDNNFSRQQETQFFLFEME
ncbi:MAG: esterase-like activity of phytase family protein, partial [Flavisolibacter sp.]